MKVAALQLNSQNNVGENLAQAERLLTAALDEHAELVVLPEGFAFLGPEAEKYRCAEDIVGSGPIMSTLRSWSKRYGISIVAGGLAERAPDQSPPFNTSVALNEQGTVLASYRKMHLFDIDLKDGTRLFESKATSRGACPQVVKLNEWCVGLSICYDLRFPELYRWQREQGAQLITVPAAFTQTTGAAHWHHLLRARAIETQCFVVAAAQQGEHPAGRKTFGHTMIVDPWGKILAEVTEPGPGLSVAELDRALLDDVRLNMPIFSHRHPFFHDAIK